LISSRTGGKFIDHAFALNYVIDLFAHWRKVYRVAFALNYDTLFAHWRTVYRVAFALNNDTLFAHWRTVYRVAFALNYDTLFASLAGKIYSESLKMLSSHHWRVRYTASH